jgi:hypothetical protein
MVISWFSSNAYPKLGVFQIVANQSRKLDIWRSLNEGGAHRSFVPCDSRYGKNIDSAQMVNKTVIQVAI